MTTASILTSAWVWLAAAFLGAALGVVVWSLFAIGKHSQSAAERELDARMEAAALKRWQAARDLQARQQAHEAAWRRAHPHLVRRKDSGKGDAA